MNTATTTLTLNTAPVSLLNTDEADIDTRLEFACAATGSVKRASSP